MSDCLACVNHVDDGTSLEWCEYRRKHPDPPAEKPAEISANALEMQIRKKLSKAEHFYRTGKVRIAENLSHEAARLEFEIRRMKKDGRKDA